MASILKVDQIQTPSGAAPTADSLGIELSGSVVSDSFYTWGTRSTYSAGLLVTLMDVRTFTKKFDSSKSYLIVESWTPLESGWSYANSPYILVNGSSQIHGYGHHVDTATSGTNAASFNKSVQIRLAITNLNAGSHTFAAYLKNANSSGYSGGQTTVVNPTNADDGRYPSATYSTLRVTEIMY